ncbi:DUF309 domain-containing protein [Metallosphaera tengchongensis]|nr:DUF309 domain-containing protein [Metallosphaera tengchongensis]
MERFLLFYPINQEIEKRRGSNYEVIEIRQCKFKEVDVLGNVEEAIHDMGKPIFTVRVGGDEPPIWDLLNDCRFWEAHEKLEGIWRQSKDPERKYLQALILLCASMIKYRKNPRVSDELIAKALSLISELPEDLLPLLYVRLGLNA